MRTTLRTLIVAMTVFVLTQPATAFQTEVDQPEIQWKRTGLAKWHDKMDKAARAVEAAVQVTTPDPVPVPVTGGIADVICSVFGAYCSEALSVASCESGLNPSAVNGQYFGLFQMGETERATYGGGYSTDPGVQSRAAYAYFVASGRDWSPWACKP